MDTFSVVFYETLSGDKPAKVFLNELSDKQRAKTIRDLKMRELRQERRRAGAGLLDGPRAAVQPAFRLRDHHY